MERYDGKKVVKKELLKAIIDGKAKADVTVEESQYISLLNELYETIERFKFNKVVRYGEEGMADCENIKRVHKTLVNNLYKLLKVFVVEQCLQYNDCLKVNDPIITTTVKRKIKELISGEIPKLNYGSQSIDVDFKNNNLHSEEISLEKIMEVYHLTRGENDNTFIRFIDIKYSVKPREFLDFLENYGSDDSAYINVMCEIYEYGTSKLCLNSIFCRYLPRDIEEIINGASLCEPFKFQKYQAQDIIDNLKRMLSEPIWY